MPTLYRQYRPQNFAEILGQNYIKTILQNEILSNKIAHAYLFCGPRAVGKTTMARVLAKAVNCLNRKEGEFEPCNQCENCLNINTGRNLDIVEIDAASNTGVDNVRENIISSSRVGGSNNNYKVFIIDEVHMLSISAFNALLKVVEEPPAHVIFILCTTEIHKVPSTIISRCQRFDFKRISLADMVKKLEYIVKKEDIKVEKGILETIARHADGYLRDAESLLGQILSLGDKEITQADADLVIPHSDFNEIINLLDYLNKKDTIKAIKLVNNLVDNGINLRNFIIDLVEVLRKITLNKVSPTLSESLGLDYGESLELKISELSTDLKLEQLVGYVKRFSEVGNDLKNSHIIQLPMELAIIDLCGNSLINPKGLDNKEKNTPTPIVQNNYTPPVEAVKKEVPVNGSLNLEQIKAGWNEVLIKVKPFNHSLSFVLQACEVSALKGQELFLTFKYKFHKDRIGEANIKTTLEQVLSEVYKSPLSVVALVDENLNLSANSNLESEVESKSELPVEPKKENNNLINNILETFGGEVVS